MARRLVHLDPKRAIFFLCDIQEKFRPALFLFENMVANAKRLTHVGKVMEIPLVVTEQYPEKLGKIVKEIEIDHAAKVVAKTRFSMLLPEIECCMKTMFAEGKPRDVVLYGLESHVCVEQTAIELLQCDINVFIVADCVSSRTSQDRDMALLRLCSSGCFITTSESVIYDLLRDMNHPKFNDLRKILLPKSADLQIGAVQNSNAKTLK